MANTILFDEELDYKLTVLSNAITGLHMMPSEGVKAIWAVPMLSDMIGAVVPLLNKYKPKDGKDDKKICCLYVERGCGRLERVTKKLATGNITFFVKDDTMELDEKVPYKIMARMGEFDIDCFRNDPDVFRIEA